MVRFRHPGDAPDNVPDSEKLPGLFPGMFPIGFPMCVRDSLGRPDRHGRSSGSEPRPERRGEPGKPLPASASLCFGPSVAKIGNTAYCKHMASTDLAALLKAARAAKGDSLRSAARQLGVDASYLSRVEAGERRPSEELRQRASHYYDVPDDQVQLAAGDVPSDILEILQRHPELIDRLRNDYGRAG